MIRRSQTKGLFRGADLVCYLDDYAEKTPDITAFYFQIIQKACPLVQASHIRGLITPFPLCLTLSVIHVLIYTAASPQNKPLPAP